MSVRLQAIFIKKDEKKIKKDIDGVHFTGYIKRTNNEATDMITRKDYLERNATHREYYAQFVTPRIIAIVKNHLGDQIAKSESEHFHDISLPSWDAVLLQCGHEADEAMRKAGDYPTLAGMVCVAKEAAKQIKEAK